MCDFLARVGEAIDEELEVLEGVALAADEAAGIAGAHLKNESVGRLLLVDLEDEAQRTEDHLQDMPG